MLKVCIYRDIDISVIYLLRIERFVALQPLASPVFFYADTKRRLRRIKHRNRTHYDICFFLV